LAPRLFIDSDRHRVTSGMMTLSLSKPLRALVPSLWVSSLPRNAIGFSFERGKRAVAIGCFLMGANALLAAILYPAAGLVGVVISVWLVGSTGALMVATGLRPLAFVKPLCSGCRLLPIIQEHEAIHLAGEASDDEVWKLMRTRHSCESLRLHGDPSICWFCPIPKRLSEH